MNQTVRRRFGCFKVFDSTSAQSSLLSFVVCGQQNIPHNPEAATVGGFQGRRMNQVTKQMTCPKSAFLNELCLGLVSLGCSWD